MKSEYNDAGSINVGQLMSSLQNEPDGPLLFSFNDSTIRPGYHVTEIKHALMTSVDCGWRPNQVSPPDKWSELVIQLLDGAADTSASYMSTSIFMGIVGKATRSLFNVKANADTASLLFEFAPGNQPMHVLAVESISRVNEETRVALVARRAVCKPAQRFLQQQGGADGLQTDSSSVCCKAAPSSASGCCS